MSDHTPEKRAEILALAERATAALANNMDPIAALGHPRNRDVAIVTLCIELVATAKERDLVRVAATIPMRLTCPACNTLHIDEGEFATKPHHTHACQACGAVWRPAIVATVGVRFLPGFKNETP